MFVDAEKFAIQTLADAPTNSLMIATSRPRELMWLFDSGGKKWVRFLSGSHAGGAFVAEGNDHWTGIVVGPVSLRVDVTSFHEGQSGGAHSLRARDGELGVPAEVKNAHGFDDLEWLPIRSTRSSRNGAYFSRWSLWLEGPDEEWVECAAFIDGEFASPLVPK